MGAVRLGHGKGPPVKRVLLGAFACSPTGGGEGGVGWRYAQHLVQEHEVWVLTDPARRSAIESHPDSRHARLHFIYHRPRWLRGLPMNWATAHLLYQAWQATAWRRGAELDRRAPLDLVWHLTYGVYRQPSRLWRIGRPFVIGPVGGGESAPLRLWPAMGGLAMTREGARWVFNALARWQPGFSACFANARLVMCKTGETQRRLPHSVERRSIVMHEIGALAVPDVRPRRAGPATALHFIYAGRLIGMKGVNLALAGLAHFLRAAGRGHLTIVGDGPRRQALVDLAHDLGIAAHVEFTGQLTQDQLFQHLRAADVFVFPSLHDSSGNVVLEAISFGLPVIHLDLGGPRTLLDTRCGIEIATPGRRPQQVARAIGEAMLEFARDPGLLERMSGAALQRADALTWDRQIECVLRAVHTWISDEAGTSTDPAATDRTPQTTRLST